MTNVRRRSRAMRLTCVVLVRHSGKIHSEAALLANALGVIMTAKIRRLRDRKPSKYSKAACGESCFNGA